MWQSSCAILILLCLGSSVFAETMIVRHIRPSDKDSRLAYRLELLELAFAKAKTAHRLVPVDSPMPISRAFIEMNTSNPALDIITSQTSIEREEKLRPIRFPIDRGVMGCRVFLVSKENQNLFKDVQTIEDLKKYDFGLMKSWLDAELFQAAGLKIIYASKYENLFDMVAAGRFAAYSRSVAEVTAEQRAFSTEKKPLIVERNIMLHYPAAEYFFVRKTDEKLYKAVHEGLAKAYADGSFFKLFDKYFAADFAALEMKKRRVIKIQNPYLPKQVMDADPKWWYHK